MLRHPAEQQIGLVERQKAGRDTDGNRQHTDATLPPVTGLFAPSGSVEVVSGQDTVIEQDTVYLFPPVPDLTPIDGVVVNGKTYEIDGAPQPWSDRGVVVRLKKSNG